MSISWKSLTTKKINNALNIFQDKNFLKCKDKEKLLKKQYVFSIFLLFLFSLLSVFLVSLNTDNNNKMILSSLMLSFVFCTAAYSLFMDVKEKKSSIKDYKEVSDWLNENLSTKKQWSLFLNERNKVIEVSYSDKALEIIEMNKFLTHKDKMIAYDSIENLFSIISTFLRNKENKENKKEYCSFVKYTQLEQFIVNNNYQIFENKLLSNNFNFSKYHMEYVFDKQKLCNHLSYKNLFQRICSYGFLPMNIFILLQALLFLYINTITTESWSALYMSIFLFSSSFLFSFFRIKEHCQMYNEQKKMMQNLFSSIEDMNNFAIKYIKIFKLKGVEKNNFLQLCDSYVFERKKDLKIETKILINYLQYKEKENKSTNIKIGQQMLKDYEIEYHENIAVKIA